MFGGGHNGYGGNELYAFSLETLEWERLTDPTVDPDRCVDMNYDGTPTSRHTYGGLEYIESAGRLFQSGGAPDCASGGGGLDLVWTFDFGNAAWHNMNPGGVQIDDYVEQKAVYDPETDLVYFHAHGWFEYDYGTNTWAERASFNNWSSLSIAIDLEQRVVIEIGDGEALLFDLALEDRMGVELTADGTPTIAAAGNPGLKWDDAAGRVVAWIGGTDVYSLDLQGNAWETHPPADSNTVTPSEITAAGGTYGRFAYSRTDNVYVLVNSALENVYLHKLSPGGGSPPPPPPGTDTGSSSGDDDGGTDDDGGEADDDAPATSGLSGDDGDSEGSDGAPADGGADLESGGDDGEGGGCSCRAATPWPGLGLLVLLLAARRRQSIA